MSDFETEYGAHYKAALKLFSQTGSVEEVYQFIDSIPGNDGDFRDVTLGKFALLLVPRGELSGASRFCGAISNPLERADSLFEVACKLREVNLFEAAKNFLERAIESAQEVERPYETAMAFLQIADLLERLGEAQKALDLLHRAIDLAKPTPQAFEASKTLRGCARILARWNRVLEAIEIAQAIEVPELRATTMEEVQGRGQWPVLPSVRQSD